jgi:hypothetical protein
MDDRCLEVGAALRRALGRGVIGSGRSWVRAMTTRSVCTGEVIGM